MTLYNSLSGPSLERHPEFISGSIVIMKKGYVYILSNYNRTSLYIGVTNDVESRVLEHKAGVGSKFTTKYNIKYLMLYEEIPSIKEAISREKQLKNWKKEWKWNLIKEENPNLNDLASDWFDDMDIKSVLTGKFN